MKPNLSIASIAGFMLRRIVYKILLPSSGGKGKRLKKAKATFRL